MRLRDLTPLEQNARYMEKAEFDRLVENLKRDGRLTSVPLVARAGDSPLTSKGPDAIEILSGNHRVEAAIAAGIEEADVMEIVTPTSRDRKIAIQLSHNAIAGKDDPNTLGQLYGGLDLEMKLYSGLTDEDFKVKEIDVAGLSIGAPEYLEIGLLFLPEDADIFLNLVKEIEKRAKRPVRLVGHYDDFNAVFDAAVKTKDKLNIHNNAVALRRMAELALERLEQIDADSDGDGNGAGDAR